MSIGVPIHVEAYAGEKIFGIDGINYFVKQHSVYAIHDDGHQDVMYTHSSIIDTYSFMPNQQQIAIISAQRLEILSLKDFSVIVDYSFKLQCSHISVSADSQLLVAVTPYPKNQLYLYRLLSNDEPFLLTKTKLDQPKRLDIDPSDLLAEQKQYTPWIVAEFLPGSSQNIILINRQGVYLGVVQIKAQFVVVQIGQIGRNPRIPVPIKPSLEELIECYTLKNLFELKGGQDNSQMESQVNTLLQQCYQFQQSEPKSQQTILPHGGKTVQDIISQIQKPLRQNDEISEFTTTNLRNNIKQIITSEFESICQFCEFTGQYSVFNSFVFVVCRNFGILTFLVDNTKQYVDPIFGFLDFDYDSIEGVNKEKLSQLSDENLGLVNQTTNAFENIIVDEQYKGDRRLTSVACNQIVTDYQIQLVLGFQDTSIKYFDIQVQEAEINVYEKWPKPAQQMQYHLALGPIIRLQMIQLDPSSIFFNYVSSNKMTLVNFCEQLCYVQGHLNERSEKIKVGEPLMVLQCYGQSTDQFGQNLRKNHINAMIRMKLFNQMNVQTQSENTKLYWKQTLDNLDKKSDVISDFIIQLMHQHSQDKNVRAEIASFTGEDGKTISVSGTLDGRLIINQQGKQNYTTARIPINILDKEWLVPDPITSLDSIQQVKVVITGHASGYLRFYNLVGDGSVKLLNRIKVSDLPITNICTTQDQQAMMVSDSGFNCFYLSSIQKDSLILGQFNILSMPNLSPFDQNSNFAGVTVSYNNFVLQQLNKLIYSVDEIRNQLKQKSDNQQSVKYCKQSIMNAAKKPTDELSMPAKVMLGSEKITDENVEKIQIQVKPLLQPFLDQYLKEMFNHIVKICCTRESFYVALSNGDIVKLGYPSSDRIMTANDQGLIVIGNEFATRMQQANAYELEQLENKYFQIGRTQIIDPVEMSPQVLRTGYPISSFCVDPCAVPPPCIVSDLIYIGLKDGRVMVYQMKSAHEKQTIQQQSVMKNDLPLSQYPLVSMKSQIIQLQIHQNVLLIADEYMTLLGLPCVPQVAFLKKTAAQILKNDDILPPLPTSELLINQIQASDIKLSGPIRSCQTQNYVAVDTQYGLKHIKLQSREGRCELSIVMSGGEYYLLEIPQQFINTCSQQQSSVDAASRQFIQNSLQQSGAIDGNVQNKTNLKMSNEMRNLNRNFFMTQQDQSTIQQLMITIQAFVDGPLKTDHPFCSHVTQHLCKRWSMEAADLLNQNNLLEHKDDILQYKIEDNVKNQELQKKQLLNKIALDSLKIETSYSQAARLAGLIVTSNLRIRTNSLLVDEAVKICEIAKDIEKQNLLVLKEKGLQVLPVNSSLTFLQHGEKLESNPSLDYKDVQKILAGSSRLNENELRISSQVSNLSRAALIQNAAEYEKQFKADLLASKAYLHSLTRDRILSADKSQVGEAVCGLQDKNLFVGSIPVPANAQLTIAKAKKIALLRSAQLVSERMAPYLPPALVKNSEGKYVLPSASERNKQNQEQQQTFVQVTSRTSYEFGFNVAESETYEPPTIDQSQEDPFGLTSHEQSFQSGTLLKTLGLGTEPKFRAPLVPFVPKPVYTAGENLPSQIQQLPSIKRFSSISTPSLRRACFMESEIVFSVRAMQQMYLLKAINILLIKDANQKILKVKDQKFRSIQKLQEFVQQLKDIGKELTYYAREQTMTELIEQQRKKLFSDFLAAGVAMEECAERASKQAPLLGSEEEIGERAINLLPMDLLDINTVVGFVNCDHVDKTESLSVALGFDPYGQQDDKKKQNAFVLELRKLASQCTVEKFSLLVALFLNEIKAGTNQNAQVTQALQAFTDEGLFAVENIENLIEKTRRQLNNQNVIIDPEVMKMAAAYKRALYEMMRGSVDASNRVSVRDIVIPPSFGLQNKAGVKLSKEQEAQIEAYLTKLKEIDESRNKEQKRLVAMAQKLREQASDLSTQFDYQTLKQLRDRRFNAEIKIQALQLNQCLIVQRQLQRQKQLMYLQEKNLLGQRFSELKLQFAEYRKWIKEIQLKYAEKSTQILDDIKKFNDSMDKANIIQDAKMRELLKKNVNATVLAQNIRQVLNGENRQKIQQNIYSNYKQLEQQYQSTLDLFFTNTERDITSQYFKEVSEAAKTLFDQFFKRQNLQGTHDKSSFSSLFNDMIFPDGIYPELIIRNSKAPIKAANIPIRFMMPFMVLYSKLIPLESIQEFADLKLSGKNAVGLSQTFDILRSFKGFASIVSQQVQLKSAQMNTFVNELNAIQNELDNSQQFETQAEIEKLKQLFANAAVLNIIKEGQTEYPRPFEALNDQFKIQYNIDEQGNIQAVTDVDRIDLDSNDDIVMRDDSQFLIIDKDYIAKTINDTLSRKGAELKSKLEDISKIHMRINQLRMKIEITQQLTKDFNAQTTDFQMIKVSKEMLDIIRTNTSTEVRKAQEVKTMMNKLEHSRKAHEIIIKDRDVQIARIPEEADKIHIQNQILMQKIEELEAKNIQREQAIPDFVDEEGEEAFEDEATTTLDLEELSKKYLMKKQKMRTTQKTLKEQEIKEQEETDKKFRRIAALRKMRELSKAQEEEMQFLINELDKLRKKTYPSFE
ncbi:Conserved_hypothetical protein [Hexamita inflata]|uniref:Uncharacterized protein n=1 Tax=Hexamita inflata TaxID=28002 RepID=A0AA86Q1P7_9EUKA|nr:Conserved hypothetical protein [Hexamita inflata]CAI9950236.1 Conserved hypothetical protein [Hexamita inflata]